MALFDRLRHRPLNCGGRFSTNARMASFESSVLPSSTVMFCSKPVAVAETHRLDGVERMLGEAHRHRALGRDLAGDGHGALHQPGRRHAGLDHAEPVQLLAVDPQPGEQHAAGAGMPEQPHRVAAAAEQADVDLGQADGRFLGGDQDVAGGGDRQPGAERDAVDRADHRLLAFRWRGLADAALCCQASPG
jgi:hypothetical protein